MVRPTRFAFVVNLNMAKELESPTTLSRDLPIAPFRSILDISVPLALSDFR